MTNRSVSCVHGRRSVARPATSGWSDTRSLVDQSRAPLSRPQTVPATVVEKIVAVRRRHPRSGPRRLLVVLRRQEPTSVVYPSGRSHLGHSHKSSASARVTTVCANLSPRPPIASAGLGLALAGLGCPAPGDVDSPSPSGRPSASLVHPSRPSDRSLRRAPDGSHSRRGTRRMQPRCRRAG